MSVDLCHFWWFDEHDNIVWFIGCAFSVGQFHWFSLILIDLTKLLTLDAEYWVYVEKVILKISYHITRLFIVFEMINVNRVICENQSDEQHPDGKPEFWTEEFDEPRSAVSNLSFHVKSVSEKGDKSHDPEYR